MIGNYLHYKLTFPSDLRSWLYHGTTDHIITLQKKNIQMQPWMARFQLLELILKHIFLFSVSFNAIVFVIDVILRIL